MLKKKMGKNLYVIGDSHGNIYRDHFHHIWVSAVTMHRVGRDGVASMLPRGIDITKESVVLFVTGEIDCRCHIHVQTTKQSAHEDVVLNDLAVRYITSLCVFRDTFGCKVIVRGVVPPLRVSSHNDGAYPMRGSLESRKRWQGKLNDRLKTLCCSDASLLYHPSPNWAEDDTGMLLAEMSDGEVHVSQACSERASHDMLQAIA